MTGLMSLAYMAELGTVFNLAYAELTKGRYIAQITRLSQLPALVGEVGSNNHSDAMKLGQLVKKIENLSCRSFLARATAWGEFRTTVNAQEMYGSFGVLLYRDGNDRTLAFFFAFISSLIVVLSTAAEHWSFVDYGWMGEKPWGWLTASWTEKLFFALLLLAMIAPLGFVLFGRKLSKVAGAVASEVTEDWNVLANKKVEDMLPKAIEARE